jgi:hypothetical protein
MVTTNSTTCSSVDHCWLRAWERAKAELLIPYRETLTTWTVKHYTVTVTGTGWSYLACSCPAGRSRKICKHMAVVAKAISAHVVPVKGTAKRQQVPASAMPVARGPSASLTNRLGPDVGQRHSLPPLDDPVF